MQLKVFGLRFSTLLTMKLLILLTVIACFQSSARGYGQTVTLSLENASLENAFKEIKKQTGYSFVYTRVQLKNTLPVTCQVKNGNLKEALELCFRNQPLSYLIEDHYIVVQTKTAISQPLLMDISGKVTNEDGEALAGVTITTKHSNKGTSTNEQGEFSLKGIREDDILIITRIGHYKEEIPINKQTMFLIKMKISVGNLDETVVIAYGTTTRRLNTGTVNKVTSETIANQPISNPLAALQGRIPGLVITQNNGLPGSGFNVLIRGRNSIQNGIAPLFIVDGIPFLSTDDGLTQRSSINANNPFSTLNPEDIASIEVLKDADATAIYGSRGANGVILITTKHPKVNESQIEVNIYHGLSSSARTMKFMNTSQYLQMRREAFANDGIIPDVISAPDLLLWDTSRNINWRKILMGEKATNFNAGLRFNGGNEITSFTLGANYYNETTIFPGDFQNKQANVSLSVIHKPKQINLNSEFSFNYSAQNSKLPLQNMGQYLSLPPNAMEIHDSIGNISWNEGAEYFGNPLALFRQTFTGITHRLSTNGVLKYKFNQKLNFTVTGGYNNIWFEETSLKPIASQDPASNPLGATSFGNTAIENWAIEPQLDYNSKLGSIGKLQFLVGASLQESQTKKSLTSGFGYTNDLLIGSLSGAASTVSSNSKHQYRYQAIFSRLNYNWNDRYIANLTARRDGSSRFGPAKRNANFAAAGICWVFTNEKILKNKSLLSFGKIRGSYGITGNDQINNYQYLDTWSGTRYPYQGIPGLQPSKLFNPDYSWEQIQKTEAAIELGLFKNRLLITVNWFKNRSDNQIINYNLPSQTGFDLILKNFPGIVENKGIEMQIENLNIKTNNFEWSSGFNITFSKNRLLVFPGLQSSSYASSYIIGKPLNSFIGYRFLGLDPQTGLYTFDDINRNGQIDFDAGDYVYNGSTDPIFYGGLQNTVKYKNFVIDFLFEFKKQSGVNNINNSSILIGSLTNMPKQVLNRWQKPGDISGYQKFSQDFVSDAYLTTYYYSLSSAVLADASYIRLKNINISFRLDTKILKKIKIGSLKIYLQAQNLLTLTKYPGSDPENQSFVALPPMKTIVAGIKLAL